MVLRLQFTSDERFHVQKSHIKIRLYITISQTRLQYAVARFQNKGYLADQRHRWLFQLHPCHYPNSTNHATNQPFSPYLPDRSNVPNLVVHRALYVLPFSSILTFSSAPITASMSWLLMSFGLSLITGPEGEPSPLLLTSLSTLSLILSSSRLTIFSLA